MKKIFFDFFSAKTNKELATFDVRLLPPFVTSERKQTTLNEIETMAVKCKNNLIFLVSWTLVYTCILFVFLTFY